MDGFRAAVLPVCDRLMRSIDSEGVKVEYAYRVARKTEDGRIEFVFNDPSHGTGLLVHSVEIGAGWQSEVKMPAPLLAIAHLRGILVSLPKLPSTTHAQYEAFREVLRWFRFAFEIPFIWDAGHRRKQSENKSKPREDRIERISREVLSRGLSKAEAIREIQGWGVGKSMAYEDFSEAERRRKSRIGDSGIR